MGSTEAEIIKPMACGALRQSTTIGALSQKDFLNDTSWTKKQNIEMMTKMIKDIRDKK